MTVSGLRTGGVDAIGPCGSWRIRDGSAMSQANFFAAGTLEWPFLACLTVAHETPDDG